MRRATLAAAVLLVLVPSAPAKAPLGPAAVVRAWTAALNRSDNEAAANLFAKNAVVIQNGLRLVLFSHHIAALWMKGVPCSGRLVHITVTKDLADAIFVLGSRKGIKCDAPGIKARAAFVVRNGRIIRWVQLPVPKSAA
jgi:limonene-1,2-epoxide hydrolase